MRRYKFDEFYDLCTTGDVIEVLYDEYDTNIYLLSFVEKTPKKLKFFSIDGRDSAVGNSTNIYEGDSRWKGDVFAESIILNSFSTKELKFFKENFPNDEWWSHLFATGEKEFLSNLTKNLTKNVLGGSYGK